MSSPLRECIARITTLILDVDGVLTDGSIIYTDAGAEAKAFHVRDGSGLKLWKEAGRRAGILSGRSSAIVLRRAAELGCEFVVQGVDDKLEAFFDLCRQKGLQTKEVCYVGDDIPDLPVLCNCGFGVAVADACPEARAQAHYITKAPGGRGAVREVIELILREQRLWQPLTSSWMIRIEALRDSAPVTVARPKSALSREEIALAPRPLDAERKHG